MKKLDKLEVEIDTLESQLEEAKRRKQDFLRKTICDKEGHDCRKIFTGCWECVLCGDRHWTV